MSLSNSAGKKKGQSEIENPIPALLQIFPPQVWQPTAAATEKPQVICQPDRRLYWSVRSE